MVSAAGPGLTPRLFDGGWVRNPYGGLVEPAMLEVLVSVAVTEGRCSGVDGLWTYRVHGLRIPKGG